MQDMSVEQALKEGFNSAYEFNVLWDKTIKKQDLDKYGWNANPWIWVYEFERIEMKMRTIEELQKELSQLARESVKRDIALAKLELEVKELSDLGVSLERLQEICTAEREGRLVVLPCKIGTELYSSLERKQKKHL